MKKVRVKKEERILYELKYVCCECGETKHKRQSIEKHVLGHLRPVMGGTPL